MDKYASGSTTGILIILLCIPLVIVAGCGGSVSVHKPAGSTRGQLHGVDVGSSGESIFVGHVYRNPDDARGIAWIRKYDPQGKALWTQTFSSGDAGTAAQDACLDPHGDAFVIGDSQEDMKTIAWLNKYGSSDGKLLWSAKEEQFTVADVVCDDDGNLVVLADNGNDDAGFTLKKYRGSDGRSIWSQNFYQGVSPCSYELVVSHDRSLFIAGTIVEHDTKSAVLLKLSGSDGSILWQNVRPMAFGDTPVILSVAVSKKGDALMPVSVRDPDMSGTTVGSYTATDGQEGWLAKNLYVHEDIDEVGISSGAPGSAWNAENKLEPSSGDIPRFVGVRLWELGTDNGMTRNYLELNGKYYARDIAANGSGTVLVAGFQQRGTRDYDYLMARRLVANDGDYYLVEMEGGQPSPRNRLMPVTYGGPPASRVPADQQVIYDFYSAINASDYQRAYSLCSKDFRSKPWNQFDKFQAEYSNYIRAIRVVDITTKDVPPKMNTATRHGFWVSFDEVMVKRYPGGSGFTPGLHDVVPDPAKPGQWLLNGINTG
ncbi:MAG: hypothetical protein PHP64_06500 [Actinomycetota bacterium]|nr:hypothetical protein [Actinomycetota bacterium]